MTDEPINGHNHGDAPTVPDPAQTIAQRLYAAQSDDGDDAWDELDIEVRQSLVDTVEIALALHAAWLLEQGYRIVPPGAFPRPKTDEEAAVMLIAVRQYREAKKARKPGLLMNERRLILPKDVH